MFSSGNRENLCHDSQASSSRTKNKIFLHLSHTEVQNLAVSACEVAMVKVRSMLDQYTVKNEEIKMLENNIQEKMKYICRTY